MTRIFIELPEFKKNWLALGLTDEDLYDLELFLISNPETGKVISKTGGLRKIRWSAKGKGKRSGARVLYVDFIMFNKLYLVAAYSKNEKVDISENEKKRIKNLIEILKDENYKNNKER